MRRRDPRRRSARLALTLLITLATLLLSPSSGNAFLGCEEKLAPKAKVTGQGIEGLLNNDTPGEDDIGGVRDSIDPDKGLYESYLISGTSWFVIVPTDKCGDEQRTQLWPIFYNGVWGLARIIDMVAIETVAFAMNPPLDDLQGMAVDVIESARDSLWRPMIPAIVILASLTLGWWALIRKRATLAYEGAIWMVLATTFGLWILYSPASYFGLIGKVSETGSALVASAVSDTGGSGGGNCIPGSPEIVQRSGETDQAFVARLQSENLYEALVCEPWKAGMFGSGPMGDAAAEKYGLDTIHAQALTRIEAYGVGVNEDADGQDTYYESMMDHRREQFLTLSNTIEEESEYTWEYFRGSSDIGGERTGAALTGLAASVIGAVVIIAASIALITVKLGFILLAIVAPIFFLVGIHPSYGKGVLLRWVELLIGLLMKSFMWVALLALLVWVMTSVLSIRPYGLALILMAAIVVAVLKYKDDLWGVLNTVKIAGASSGSDGGGGGYSALRHSAVSGGMNLMGRGVRKGGGAAGAVAKTAVKGMATASGVGAAGVFLAEKAIAQKAKSSNAKNSGTKNSGKLNEGVAQAFSGMRKANQAPGRNDPDGPDPDRVRQGAGASRPTVERPPLRKGGQPRRSYTDAPNRHQGQGEQPSSGGARGGRTPDKAPRQQQPRQQQRPFRSSSNQASNKQKQRQRQRQPGPRRRGRD